VKSNFELKANMMRSGQSVELEALVERLSAEPALIKDLLDSIRDDKSSGKYLSEKAIRRISETRPELLLPHLDRMLELAQVGNTFIRCGIIISLSNIIPRATAVAALSASKGYLELMASDSLLIAGSASRNAWKVARAWPGLEPCITKSLLSIPSRTFIHNAEPSPECKNIMVGHALEAFSEFFEASSDKKGIMDFIEKAKANERPSVARRANMLHKRLSKD